MTKYSRFKTVFHHYGLRGVFAKLIGKVADRYFEWRYGLDTIACAQLDKFTISAGSRANATAYEGSRILPLKRLFPALRQLVPGDGALVDLGCGKGKVMLVAALSGLQKVRGVEFARELCDVARKNWGSVQSKAGCTTDFQVVEGDVTTYAIRPDETIFYIFNPFDETILGKVLSNIANSTQSSPRRVVIVVCFLSERYRRIFDQQPAFSFAQEFVFWGYSFSVFSNQPNRG
jgi:hypothetical protein